MCIYYICISICICSVYMYFDDYFVVFEIRFAAVAGYKTFFALYCCGTLSLTMMLLPVASMGHITGRLGLAFIRLPFVLHIPVAPLPWVRSFSGLCSLRSHVQLPSPLGFVPWAWSSLDSLGLDLEFWPGPFLSVVWDSAAFCSVDDYSWVVF